MICETCQLSFVATTLCPRCHRSEDIETKLSTLRANQDRACPRKHIEPCQPNCTCAHGTSSAGCLRCCSYGSKEQRIAAAKRIVANQVVWKPFPEIMGKPITREEIMEGIWDAYRGFCAFERKKNPSFVRYPDMETILNHIEENGLPPKPCCHHEKVTIGNHPEEGEMVICKQCGEDLSHSKPPTKTGEGV